MAIVARVGERSSVGAAVECGAPGTAVEESIEGRLIEEIGRRVGRERFELWFEGKTRLELDGGTLRLAAGNAFAANWIRGKLAGAVEEAAGAVLGHPVELEVVVESRESPRAAVEVSEGPAAPSKPAESSRPGPSGGAGGPVLNPKYTLEEFVVGPANQMAYHAAVRVAEEPGREFNPLFIHGQCGVGKTHLLQGLCQRFAKRHPGKKWLYMTGEQFTNEFLEAIRNHKSEAFRRKIRGADLLVIDDVHFLANKKATQEEFLHTFNQIDLAGRQVVLASDSAPGQIAAMAEGLVNRFVSGMVLRVDAPDLPTRLEILRRRAARNRWQVSDAVLMHIASNVTASVRELEGTLLQAVAGMRLSGRADAAGMLEGLRERTGAARCPVAVEKIVAAAAEHFGVSQASLLGSGREKTVSLARAVAMHLGRQHTPMSYPELGRALGNKNHSTVIAACQRVEALIAGGEVLCWQAHGEARHQAMADAVREIEARMRKG